MGEFNNKTVIITGAAGGFGSAAAVAFAREGANLVLSDFDLERLKESTKGLDADFQLHSGDIAVEDTSKEIVGLAVSKYGSLDVAVNNAGIAQPFMKMPKMASEAAERMIAINLMGVFYAMKYQLPVMEKAFRDTGALSNVINLASVAGLVGASGGAMYAASKHGVIGLTKSTAMEYAKNGVRINALCPSFARTAMVQQGLMSGGRQISEEELVRGIPMGRIAEVDEVINAMIFLAGSRNSFMTGQALSVDGGLTAY